MRILILARGIPYVADLSPLVGRVNHDAAGRALEDGFVDAVPALVTATSPETSHRIRRVLACDPRNAAAFEVIERCAFTLCLDDGPYNRWHGRPSVIAAGGVPARLEFRALGLGALAEDAAEELEVEVEQRRTRLVLRPR